MILGAKMKAVIAVAVVGASFAAGWTGKGYYEDSKDLVALQAQNALAEELRDELGAVSRNMEQQLADFSPGQTVIDRGVVREIQTEVFRNVCVPPDSDAFRMLNRIADGESAGEHVGQGTQDAPETD